MDFIPDKESRVEEVPFFEDVNATAGWAGHATSKSEADLKAEVSMAIGRLGGMVYAFTPGGFGNRFGYRVYFNLEGGKPGQIDVVALPLRTKLTARGYDAKKKAAIKMALYNLRDQLESMWRMQQLIPGYFGLLPMMMVGSKTVGQLWVEELDAQKVLPATTGADGEVVDGEFEAVEGT
ncbi:MAG: hypothetical protein K8R40_02365 [Anaerolineaceae bacterium]|nr:hypothetical protein [Anaerolineaceae bacterium]